MNQPLKIPGSLLARNTLLNLLSQAVPLLVGVITHLEPGILLVDEVLAVGEQGRLN